MPASKDSKKATPRKPGRKPGTAMSDEHKAALAAGREASRAVRAYLDALESHKPKRGRRRTAESIAKRLAAIEDEVPFADPMKRLSLVQERIDLQAELEASQDGVDLSALEQGFIAHAKTYSDSRGITYAAWREVGVAPATLKAAGLSRSGS